VKLHLLLLIALFLPICNARMAQAMFVEDALATVERVFATEKSCKNYFLTLTIATLGVAGLAYWHSSWQGVLVGGSFATFALFYYYNCPNFVNLPG
jgi:hypothetical protein